MSGRSSGRRPDVVVVGLGTMGSMAAWQLAERGARVVGIEQYGPVHAHGSFTGESRLFRVAAKEGRRYVPALQEARQLWERLGRETGRTLLLPIGALSVGPGDSPELRETRTAIDEFALAHRMLDAADLRREYPQFRIEDDDTGILDPSGGGLRPELAVLSAQERAREHGADLRFRTPVLDIEERKDGVVVHLPDGHLHADAVVVAAGSWASRVRPGLAPLLRVRPLILTWFLPRHLSLFTSDRLPVFMRDLGDVHAFGAPSLDGCAVKVCPASRVEEQYAGIEDVPGVIDDEELGVLGARAQLLFPDLHPEPVRWNVHHDAYTPDRIPIIDRSEDGRIVTLAGFSGHGFKFAPAFGKVAAEIVLDGGSDLWREEYAIGAVRERLAF
ncbi:N-methyl-L-tryptophan oxidase [Brachybacterium sp. AOP25-B2-12]|uniref:N-methyl-L-tryptophan oxidase n=1 Tax=Brachybacterium sp. AOP25-B2-12 TaxID=3457710 RepID=UPI0040347ED2